MRMWMGSSLAIGLLAFGVGCGGSYESAWDEDDSASSGNSGQGAEQSGGEDASGHVARGDEAWAQRSDMAQVQAAIAAWEAAVEANPQDAETWIKLSRAYYFLADGHQRWEDPDAMGETWQTGIRAAERALRIMSPEFAQRMASGQDVADAVSVLEANAVPALYWRASNLGKWARADGFATVLSYKDEIRAVMTRCLELDRSYFFTGPDRYFGAFFAIAPAYAGGDLDRSRQHFEYSVSQEPNYFGTRVLMAENLAVKLQDRDMYVEQLQFVLDGDPASLEGAEPENRVEQRKAREMMEQVDELFE